MSRLSQTLSDECPPGATRQSPLRAAVDLMEALRRSYRDKSAQVKCERASSQGLRRPSLEETHPRNHGFSRRDNNATGSIVSVAEPAELLGCAGSVVAVPVSVPVVAPVPVPVVYLCAAPHVASARPVRRPRAARAVLHADPDAAPCQRSGPRHRILSVRQWMLRRRRQQLFRKGKERFGERSLPIC